VDDVMIVEMPGRVHDTFCGLLDELVNMVFASPLELVGGIGGFALPCALPPLPRMPDWIAKVQREIMPECVAELLSCQGETQVTDVWILDSALAGKTVEEAAKFWSKVQGNPYIVMAGRRGDKRVFIIISDPQLHAITDEGGAVIAIQPIVSFVIGMSEKTFNELHGPTADMAPGLLEHFKRYRVERVGDKIDLVEDNRPYYELD